MECARHDDPCGSADCGRCLPVCNTCGDDHATDDCTYRTPCAYCSAPAVIESSVGLDGDYSEPNELGQRAYEAPRPEPRCEECEADFERVARRRNWLAQEGWI